MDLSSKANPGNEFPAGKTSLRRQFIARENPIFRRAWFLLLIALAMTVLEGAARKWVYPTEGAIKYLLYFSKDLLFAGLFFLPAVSTRNSITTAAFQRWLQPGCLLLFFGIALSSLSGVNPVGAALTFRSVIFLPVMAYLAVPRLSGLPIRWIFWLVIGLTVLNFGLGVGQNRLPVDHILNRYADAEMQVVEADSGVRATGTFAYITGITVISSFGIWAGLAMMSLAKTRAQHALAWVGMVAGFGCGLVSVSRGPIVIGVAMVAGWFLSMKNGMTILGRGLAVGAICLLAAFAFGFTTIFVDLGEGLLRRNQSAGDSLTARSTGQLGEAFQAITMSPGGAGFGNEQVGGNYYATGKAAFASFESPLPRLILETGVLGLIGYLVICAGAIVSLQAAKKQTGDFGRKGLFLATQNLLAVMFYGSVVFNHTASAFTWMIFAAVLASTGERPAPKTKAIPKRQPKNQIGSPQRA